MSAEQRQQCDQYPRRPIVGTPLQWLDVLVTSVLSGAVALAVGLLAIIVLRCWRGGVR